MNRWLNSIADAGRELLSFRRLFNKSSRQSTQQLIEALCAELYSSRGEAMGTVLARAVVDAYRDLLPEERVWFFTILREKYEADHSHIMECMAAYKSDTSTANLQALWKASEPPRQELLRRINMAPEGTETIVGMREHLLALLPEYPSLAVLDTDFVHLLSSWFNRGFLALRRIDWMTSAAILEKLMQYQSVHTVNGWDDLRRRLADDRRCYAFFHPALPDEPIVFVEIALVNGMSSSIQQLMQSHDTVTDQASADTAIFYSISNCQLGLKGIHFGNFLIKQVIMELELEVPTIRRFATLSPLPGFCYWINERLISGQLEVLNPDEIALLKAVQGSHWEFDAATGDEVKPILMRLAARYLYLGKNDKNEPLDPVARFHLRNGAAVGRINWLGDTSQKGLRQSAGILVNYCYDLKHVERRHEAYVNHQEIAAHRDFLSLL